MRSLSASVSSVDAALVGELNDAESPQGRLHFHIAIPRLLLSPIHARTSACRNRSRI